MAAVVPRMLAVAGAPLTVAVAGALLMVAVVELPTAVAAVLTAIVKNRFCTFRKGPPFSNEAGLLLFQSLPSQSKTSFRNSLCACGLNK